MSLLVNKFDICHKIPENCKIKINIFHVFDAWESSNILFVTTDDMVYGLGCNSEGRLGLGHNTPIESPQEIPELCHQNIHQFIIGDNFVCAMNTEHQIYSWGRNDHGQLGWCQDTN